MFRLQSRAEINTPVVYMNEAIFIFSISQCFKSVISLVLFKIYMLQLLNFAYQEKKTTTKLCPDLFASGLVAMVTELL